LVDPDADRPNFGAGGPGAAADDDSAEFGGPKAKKKAAAAAAAAKGKAAIARAQRQKSKPINPAYLTATVSAIALISVAALLYFGRDIIEGIWPASKGFYEKAAVVEARPGDGLRWAESTKSLRRIGGIETLVIRGFVSNIDKIVKPVPGLKLQLLNERQEVLQEVEAQASTPLLNPGESVEVELRLELPDMVAAKGGYRVAWSGGEDDQ
jgi:hypothetical protein